MKISRHCYDKPRRCPGWAGGGFKYPKKYTCNGRLLKINYDSRWYRWHLHRCSECKIIVLPINIQLLDPTWWIWKIEKTWDNIRYWLQKRK